MKEKQNKDISIVDTLRFAWSIVGRSRAMLLCMVLCGCLFAAIEIALPVLGKNLFDALAGYSPSSEIGADTVWRLTYVFFAFLAAFWVFRYIMFLVWIPYSANYMRRIVEVGFERAQRFSSSWHNDTFSGSTVRNITRGMGALDGFMEVILTQFFPTFMLVVGASAYMFYAGHPYMGGALALFIVVFSVLTGTISLKLVAPLNRAANDEDSRIGGMLADAIGCNAAVKAFGNEGLELTRLKHGLDVWRARKTKAWYLGTTNGILQMVLTLALRMGFVFSAIYLWSRGQASLGDVYFCLSITSVITAYLRDFGAQLRMLQNHVNDMDPIVSYMQMQPLIADAPQAPALVVTKGEVSFENVTFGYKPGLPPLFENLSITLPAGKTVALVGRSGSGKTSFVKLVQRLYDVQGGRVLIDGQDIAGVTQESLHKSIALVPQEPVLFHRSLAENIAYARPDVPLGVVRAAAKDAHIDDFIMGLPEGYETTVGERGVKLSGGERQRVAIARAIVANRPILVMDEATSALDSVSETLIQSALDTLIQDRTTIIIAHRLSTISKADIILVFDQGRVAEQGRHEELLAKNGVYKALYTAQVDGLIV